MNRKSLIVLIVAIVLISCQMALAATVTLTGSTQTVACANNAYIVQNNIWGASTAQSIQVNTDTGAFTVTVSNHNNATNGSPAAYPSIYKGSHWGLATSNSGMPIQVGSISSCNSSWNITMGSGSYNCAYDIWFNTTSTTSGQPNGAELMIWINHQGPPQPAGSIVGTVSIAGGVWDVWFSQMSWKYIAYVRTSGVTSSSMDLNAFIKDCVSRGYIQNSWYLIDVEAGFELWQGGVGCGTTSFSVSVNGGGNNPTPTPTRAVTPTPTRTPTPRPGTTPTPTPARTATPRPGATPTPGSGSGAIKVQFYNGNKADPSNQLYLNFQLVNTGSSAITLSNVKMRYYYTKEGTASENFYCDWAQVGGSNITSAFGNGYLEVGFTGGAGSLNAGAGTQVQCRVAKSDWSNYTQSNDYSFNSSASGYVDWAKTPGYVSGALVWGTQP